MDANELRDMIAREKSVYDLVKQPKRVQVNERALTQMSLNSLQIESAPTSDDLKRALQNRPLPSLRLEPLSMEQKHTKEVICQNEQFQNDEANAEKSFSVVLPTHLEIPKVKNFNDYNDDNLREAEEKTIITVKLYKFCHS